MSEAVPHELRILIERVVRPLPIPLSRQKRLRTELLQHLQAIHAEELASDGGPIQAWNRTAQRFGNPTELTAELRETVTSWDKWTSWWEVFWAQQDNESNGHYVARIVCRFAFTLFLLTGLGMLDHHVFGTIPFSFTELAAHSIVIVYLSLWLGGLLLFALKTGEEWAQPQRRWNQIILLSLALVTAWPLTMAMLMRSADIQLSDYTLPINCSIGGGLGSLIAGIYLGTIHRRDTKYRSEWAELKLDAS